MARPPPIFYPMGHLPSPHFRHPPHNVVSLRHPYSGVPEFCGYPTESAELYHKTTSGKEKTESRSSPTQNRDACFVGASNHWHARGNQSEKASLPQVPVEQLRALPPTNSATFARMHEVWEISEKMDKIKKQETTIELYIARLQRTLEQVRFWLMSTSFPSVAYFSN